MIQGTSNYQHHGLRLNAKSASGQFNEPKFGRVGRKKKNNSDLFDRPEHMVLKPATERKQTKPLWRRALFKVGALLTFPLTLLGGGAGYLHYVRPHVNHNNAQQQASSVETIKNAQGEPIAIVERVEGVSQETMIDRAQANTYIFGPSDENGRISFGSGFTVKGPDGEFYVITNNHVVEGNTIEGENGQSEMKVKLYGNNQVVRATVLQSSEGEEVRTAVPDVAVLKLDSEINPSHFVDISNFRNLKTDPLEVGEPVFLVGNQSGLRDTVTTGIVSSTKEYRAKELSKFDTIKKLLRDRNFDEATTVFVQTDASCNGGGSGGALYDAEGRLIGIHTWHTDDYTNLCFSVRVDEVQKMLKDFGVLQTSTKNTEPLTVVNPD